ncbi:hypothetical protein [Pantoea ananatis]|jgi:hypothetical protein|uniref:hypothetical protein n=1 Tax=Pantoea ananas TaxID=553 RepID=UPI00035E4462|nr:hypothetical protein [Pantoea ananatis]
MRNSILLRMRNFSGLLPELTDRKCFVSTAIIMAAHKTLVRAAPRHPANASRPHSKLRTRSPLLEMNVSRENVDLVSAFG